MLRIRVKVNRRLQEAFSSAECVVLVTEFTFFLVHIPGVLLGQGADWKFLRSGKSMVHDLQKGQSSSMFGGPLVLPFNQTRSPFGMSPTLSFIQLASLLEESPS